MLALSVLKRNDSRFVSVQLVSLPRATSFEYFSSGKLTRPAQIQVETMAIVRILLEISPSFIGKTTATNLSIAIHTKLCVDTRKDTMLEKKNNLHKIDPRIPVTYQCCEAVTNSVILTGSIIKGKAKSDKAMFTMK